MLESYESGLIVEEPGHDDTENRQQVALWALGVIWQVPPNGVTSGEVSKMLGNKWRPRVQETIGSDEL